MTRVEREHTFDLRPTPLSPTQDARTVSMTFNDRTENGILWRSLRLTMSQPMLWQLWRGEQLSIQCFADRRWHNGLSMRKHNNLMFMMENGKVVCYFRLCFRFHLSKRKSSKQTQQTKPESKHFFLPCFHLISASPAVSILERFFILFHLQQLVFCICFLISSWLFTFVSFSRCVVFVVLRNELYFEITHGEQMGWSAKRISFFVGVGFPFISNREKTPSKQTNNTESHAKSIPFLMFILWFCGR